MTEPQAAYKTKAHYADLVKILGKRFIKTSIESPFDFIAIASKGIDAQVISNFREHFGLPRDMTAQLLQVSEPTIYRWVRSNKKLDRNHAVQLFELTDLFLYGIDVMESRDHFMQWLSLSNTALGGMLPIDLLEVPGGIDKVRDVLGRIEYGVYS